METIDLIDLILPQGFKDFFDIVKVEQAEDHYLITIEEHNVVPNQYKSHNLISKGFRPSIEILGFPIKDKACKFKVRRRVWYNSTLHKKVYNDFSLVAKGTSYTKELASFLKRN